jgi:hypothetical protein
MRKFLPALLAFPSLMSGLFPGMVVGLLVAVVDVPTPAAAAVDAHPDFDGDGWGDLAVPVTGEAISGHANAGALHVFYGRSDGFSTTDSQLWSQSGPIRDDAETDDRFGASWTSGDFDADGFDDIAIGVPGENNNTGVVNVIYGSPLGLNGAGNQLVWQNTAGLAGDAATLDGFGTTVASGDFDADGRDDLAIGAPVDASLGVSGARGGSVSILYGSATGVTTTGSQVITQDTTSVDGHAELGDVFGLALATGDIDADGNDDLAVGAPNETTTAAQAGAVTVLYGSGSGIATFGSQTISQGLAGIVDSSDVGDAFGAALAIGRFDYGPYQDLVVGVPGEKVGDSPSAGALIAVPGGGTGLRLGRSQLFTMYHPLVAGPLQGNTSFGSTLGRADFNGDGAHDLAIGVPQFDLTGVSNGGSIVTLYGGTAMFDGPIPSTMITQNTANVIDAAEPFDSFGEYVRAVDANADGKDGLFVGVPFEDVGAAIDAGAGHLFGGSAFGLVASSSTLWTQDSNGIGDSAQSDDFFGGGGILG